MKKICLVFWLILVLCVTTACGGPEANYKSAQNLLAQGKYSEAAEKFEALGSYEDATKLAIYCKACALCENGNFENGIAALQSLGEYKDCGIRIAYYTARNMERNLDLTDYKNIDPCIVAYELCDYFADSSERIHALEQQRFIASLSFIDCGAPGDGIIPISLDSKWGYIDTTGKVVSEPQWDWAWSFSEGLACVAKDRKWGYIDTTGKVVIEPQWYLPENFSDGLAGIYKDEKYGFIDTTGKVVIEPQWDGAGSFSDGLAWVENDKKGGLINREGKIVLGFGITPTFPLQ